MTPLPAAERRAREQFTDEQVQEIVGPTLCITDKLQIAGGNQRLFTRVGKDCWEEWAPAP